LGVFDLESRSFSWVNLGVQERGVTGATGMARAEDRYYVLLQHEGGRNSLLSLDNNLRVIGVWSLKRVQDGHSMVWRRGELYVVSTGTNSIIKVRPDRQGVHEEEFWRYGHYSGDAVHINSLAFDDQGLYISLFGPKGQHDNWMYADGGQILFLEAKDLTPRIVLEELFHPHSLCWWRGELFFAESRRGRICSLSRAGGGNRVEVKEWAVLPGYVRGLAGEGKQLYVAVSGLRRRSKSTGMRNTPPTDDSSLFESYIYQLDPLTGERSKERMTLYGTEIYDLLPIEEDPDPESLIRGDPVVCRLWASEDMSVDTLEVVWDLVERGEMASAARLLERLVEKDPFYGRWQFLLGFCLHRLGGEPARILWHYELALQNGFPEFWVRYHRGCLYHQLGRREAALMDLERAAALNPAHQGVRDLLAQLRRESN